MDRPLLPAHVIGDPSSWDQMLYAFLIEKGNPPAPGAPWSPTAGCSGRSSRTWARRPSG